MSVPSPQSEADLQRAIMDLAQLMGWRRLHVRAQETKSGWKVGYEGDTGWPDLTLARDGIVYFWELKRNTKSPFRPGQEEWLEVLPNARVITPEDWIYIEAVLTAPRGKA